MIVVSTFWRGASPREIETEIVLGLIFQMQHAVLGPLRWFREFYPRRIVRCQDEIPAPQILRILRDCGSR